MPRARNAAILLSLLILPVAGAIAAAAIRSPSRAFYSDADSIREPRHAAPIRSVLWQPARPLPAPLNTRADEYEPRLSADATLLVFVRGRAGQNADLFFSRLTPVGWSDPQPLPALNSPADELGPQLSPDSRRLYFYSDRPAGLGGYDLWVAHADADSWSAPVNLGSAVNSPFNEYAPALSPAGDTLFFSSNRPRPGEPVTTSDAWPATLRERRSRHDYDLFAVDLADGLPSSPVRPLDALNTAHDEGTPAISPAGDFLYFASDRPGSLGGLDLFRARLIDRRPLPPDNLGPAVNSPHDDLDPALSSDGFRLTFSSSRPLPDRPDADPPSLPRHDSAATPALAADFGLWTSASREVFLDHAPADATLADLWSSLWPWIVALLLSLLVASLIALALSRPAWRRRFARLSLLARCLLVSLCLHLLIASVFTVWKVGGHIGAVLQRGSGTRVILSSASGPGGADAAARLRSLDPAAAPTPFVALALAPDLAPPAPTSPAPFEVSPPLDDHEPVPPSPAVAIDATPAPDPPLSPPISEPAQAATDRAAGALPALEAPAAVVPEPPAESALALAADAISLAPRAAPPSLDPPPAAAGPVRIDAPAPPSTEPRAASVQLDPAPAPGPVAPALSDPPLPRAADAAISAIASLAPVPASGDASPATAEPAVPSAISAAPYPLATSPISPGVPAFLPSPRAARIELPAPSAPSSNAEPRPLPALDIDPDARPWADAGAQSAPAAPPPDALAAAHAPVELPALPAAEARDAAHASGPEPSTPPRAASAALPAPAPPDAAALLALPHAAPSLMRPVPPPGTTAPALDTAPSALAPGSFAPSTDAPGASAADRSLAPPASVGFAPPTLPDLPAEPADVFAQRDPAVRDVILERMGGSSETERAVARALDWFARHQAADGRWSARGFDDSCGDCPDPARVDSDAAVTSLVLLCYLGAGHTHADGGPHQRAVAAALDWLISRQAPDGDLRRGETMYAHSVATVALCEASAMTGDPRVRDAARRAVSFLLDASSRSPSRGADAAGDTAVLGWQVMVVRSARRAGFDVPADTFVAAARFLDAVCDPLAPGHYAYERAGTPSPAMTAEAMFVQQLIGRSRDDPRMEQSARFVLSAPPRWARDDQGGAPTHYWYYATLALFQHQGEPWRLWNERLVPELLRNQRADAGAAGSWDPQDQWSRLGGRIYQTAVCALSLEVYYRYRPEGVPETP